MDDRSVLHLVGAGGDVQVDVDVLGSVNPTVGRLSGPVDPSAPSPGTRGRGVQFTPEQKATLLKYFNEYGMTSTHRRNTELMEKCANEIGTTVARVKNWIGSEAVKRKKRAGILPRPKIEIAGSDPQPKLLSPPPAKKARRINGYNLFFSYTVRNNPNISTDFRERNAAVALRWAELEDEERKQWARKAESVSSSQAVQELQPAPLGVQGHTPSSAPSSSQQQQRVVSQLLAGASLEEINPEEALVEKTLLAIQDKFDLLEQLGYEGYSILVNTSELQSHVMATSKGKAFHKMRQQLGKPLENPFIGYVFSEESDIPSSSLSLGGLHSSAGVKRLSGIMSALNSMETMQKSVMNAFALKYKVATGRSEVPYDNLQHLGVQVYGMPPGIPFHSPLLYTQQQLQQILANLEKIVFLKVGHQEVSDLADVEISADSVASLVTSGHDLHIGAEEETSHT